MSASNQNPSEKVNGVELNEEEIAAAAGGGMFDGMAPPKKWESEAFYLHMGYEVGGPCPIAARPPKGGIPCTRRCATTHPYPPKIIITTSPAWHAKRSSVIWI